MWDTKNLRNITLKNKWYFIIKNNIQEIKDEDLIDISFLIVYLSKELKNKF